MSNEIYLVFCATGKQGKCVTQALSDKGVESIVVSSRNPDSRSVKELLKLPGVNKAVKADLGDPKSILEAINEAGATRIWFTTDWNSMSFPTRSKEAQLGYNVIDAIKNSRSKVNHVVYNSCACCDAVSENLPEFWSKADIESYMAKELASSSSGPATTWAVLRPVLFLDNCDDAKISNPLTKGKLKLFSKKKASIKFISAKDIGKGSATLLMKPDVYAGKKVDAATCEYTGSQLAEILSEVSGTPCKYGECVPPRAIVFIFDRNAYHLFNFFEEDRYVNIEMKEFKDIVPDYQDARAWFTEKGQWANGEKFILSKAC